MPLTRRVPKLGGFTPRKRKFFSLVNVSDLERFSSGSTVDPKALAEAGLIKKETENVKILGRGDLSKALTVKAHAFSGSAREKIEEAGGSAEVISA